MIFLQFTFLNYCSKAYEIVGGWWAEPGTPRGFSLPVYATEVPLLNWYNNLYCNHDSGFPNAVIAHSHLSESTDLW